VSDIDLFQLALDFFAGHFPKHFPEHFSSNHGKVPVPTEMSNPLVMIIPISKYSGTILKDLSGAKHDLGAYRNVLENEYRYIVVPENGTKMSRQAFWTRSDILNFIKKECGRLFDEGDEKEENERHDGLVIIVRGHGGEGTIYDSEGTAIPLTFLHDMVSYAQDPRFEALPRIFIVDTCRGSRGGFIKLKHAQGPDGDQGDKNDADDEKDALPTSDEFKQRVTTAQRHNLVTIYGNALGFQTFATETEGLLSGAVIKVLKQNARRKKQLAFLATDIRLQLNKVEKGQISVLDGDPSLNPLWIKPNHKVFPPTLVKEIADVSTWLQALTGCDIKNSSFFDAVSNGQYLCAALNAIAPKTCRTVYPPSENRMTNILSFIKGCRALGVPMGFVIKSTALESERNIVDVLCNLYALSVTAAKRSDYKGPLIALLGENGNPDEKDGYSYIGRIGGGNKKEGYGKMIWNDGTSYAGGYVNGKKEGWGILIRPNGDIYKGEWKKGKIDGYGRFKTIGTVIMTMTAYEGTWKDGKMSGYGKLAFDGCSAYEGQFLKGKKARAWQIDQ